ncbi:hypothetical protein [Moorella sp. E306M]|uniref:hypothetical protein n=1 Tax=Moorella sp. E306M TaxID=2572683 RepID=UPI0010FFB317|nr:hypothetical protein [Moorella sp. E306M]GEA17487.1 hypothetical protein E306M_06210 [Moorella sp. E306M]
MAELWLADVYKDRRGTRWVPERLATLRNLYPTKPNAELALMFGVSETAIRSVARRYNLKKDPEWRREQLAIIAREVAAIYGKINGQRNGPKSRRLFFNEKYFSGDLTPESAYWLGFIQADGCINIKPRCQSLTITVALKDINHLRQFLFDINANKPPRCYEKPVARSTCELVSSQLVGDLMRLGIKPNKTELGTFPIIDDGLANHYLRGVFDGDGNIYIRPDRKLDPTISVAGSRAFAEWMLNLVRSSVGILGGTITKHVKRDIWYVRFSGRNQVLLIYQWLYNNATRWLERKRRVFERLYGGGISGPTTALS